MLTLSVMIVVFVLSEKISLGRRDSNGEEKVLMGFKYLWSATVTIILSNKYVKRGKPRKWETQNMVGELV